MYLICEEFDTVINTDRVFRYSVEEEKCSECESYRYCLDVKPDRYVIKCSTFASEDYCFMGSYSKKEYAYDALCMALAEIENSKESFVVLKSEEDIKEHLLDIQKQRTKKSVVDIKLDPLKFYKK